MINYSGVSTHNLKRIDFSIEEKSIVLLKGCSGSGKSSLAIDTIYKISDDELCQLTNRKSTPSHYEIGAYSGIIPSICIQQENYNVNPRSTVGTYFCLNQFLENVFSAECHLSRESLNFNNSDFGCCYCRGLGSVLEPSVLDAVDGSKTMAQKPFRVWNVRDSDLYNQLLLAFCSDSRIPLDVPFSRLPESKRCLLLNDGSSKKYKISYKSAGIKHTKTLAFKGVVPFLREVVAEGGQLKTYGNFLYHGVCPECLGGRLSPEYRQYKVFGKSLLDYYCMEFETLCKLIKTKLRGGGNAYVAGQLTAVVKFLESAIALKLGYLTLNRSIPSLSGGELQRLCIAKANVSHFNGFLYVFDEPTSALHPSEWESVSVAVRDVRKRGNTVLLIDHSPSLEDIADRVVYLGPESGTKGGELVKPYPVGFEGFAKSLKTSFYPCHGYAVIDRAEYNTVKVIDEKIPLGSLVGICGVSGSGKTSFARHLLPHAIPGICYVNQEPIRGNSYSIVATALDVLQDMVKFFAKETKTQVANFDFIHEGRGRCAVCAGTGRIAEKSAHLVTEILCPECRGARYSKNTLRIRWKGMNFHDMLNQSIDELIALLPAGLPLRKRLCLASQAGLGYLKLAQKTEALSGGEAQRVKIVSRIMHDNRAHAFALDEPFRGVDACNAGKLMKLFVDQVEKGNSVFIIEHNPEILSCCSYLIEFGPGSGGQGGRIIYNGELQNIKRCSASKTRDYITH